MPVADVDDRLHRHRQSLAAEQGRQGEPGARLLGGAQRGGGPRARRSRRRLLVAAGDTGRDVAGEQQGFGVLGVEPGGAQEPVQLQRQPAGGQLQADHPDAEGGVFKLQTGLADDRQEQGDEDDGAADRADPAAAGHHPGSQGDQPEQAEDRHPLVAAADHEDRGGGGERLLDPHPTDLDLGELRERGEEDDREAGDAERRRREQARADRDQGDPEAAEGDPDAGGGAARAEDRIVALDAGCLAGHCLCFRQEHGRT